jgi:hypothetical protein
VLNQLMSYDSSGFPLMATACTHLVWVVSGVAKTHSAAAAGDAKANTVPVNASARQTGGL